MPQRVLIPTRSDTVVQRQSTTNVAVGGIGSNPLPTAAQGRTLKLPTVNAANQRVPLSRAQSTKAPPGVTYLPNVGTVIRGDRVGKFAVTTYSGGLPLTGAMETLVKFRYILHGTAGPVNSKAIFQNKKGQVQEVDVPTLDIGEEVIVPGRRRFAQVDISEVTAGKTSVPPSRRRFRVQRGSVRFPAGTAVFPRSPRITQGDIQQLGSESTTKFTPSSTMSGIIQMLSTKEGMAKLNRSRKGVSRGDAKLFNRSELQYFAKGFGMPGSGTKDVLVDRIMEKIRQYGRTY